ncbi:MAG: MBL fold metallo-hydrolase [Planctomycetota bacterium]|nr:MBL fold metallo-hydrolase [Planctomycetota bacterium]
MDYRVISIGTLSRHELWTKQGEPHTAHATTTLIRSGDHTILVDPGLPAPIIAGRLMERSGLVPEEITHVFMTNFRPAHRRGIVGFPNAKWLISEMEREFIGAHLVEQFKQEKDAELRKMIEQDIALLKRCTAAPDRIAPQVDLFPLPGFTPGTCGLVLSQMTSTVLIAGDAVGTAEHLEQGRVLRGCYDAQQARDSFLEVVEIADLIVPGHDNILPNPTRRVG